MSKRHEMLVAMRRGFEKAGRPDIGAYFVNTEGTGPSPSYLALRAFLNWLNQHPDAPDPEAFGKDGSDLLVYWSTGELDKIAPGVRASFTAHARLGSWDVTCLGFSALKPGTPIMNEEAFHTSTDLHWKRRANPQ